MVSRHNTVCMASRSTLEYHILVLVSIPKIIFGKPGMNKTVYGTIDAA